MKDWFRKLIGFFFGNYNGPIRLNRTYISQQLNVNLSPAAKAKTVIWTPAEAKAAWNALRTKYNLAQTFRRFAKSRKWMRGEFLVDGEVVQVVICRNEWVKKIVSGIPPEQISTARILMEETRVKEEMQKAMEEEWRRNGCYNDSSGDWVVPDELIGRSLPRGEDR